MLATILTFLASVQSTFQAPQTPADPATSPAPAALFFGDLDRDGLDDALVIGPGGAVSLFANRGQGRFEDVTPTSGLSELAFATCVLLADLDGDLDLDLYTGSSAVRLWRNLGQATFEPVASGIEHDLVDLSARPVDHDQDGLLDLHLHTEAGELLYRNLGGGRFARVELPGLALRAGELIAGGSADPVVLAPEGAPDTSAAGRRLARWQRALGSLAGGENGAEASGGAGAVGVDVAGAPFASGAAPRGAGSAPFSLPAGSTSVTPLPGGPFPPASLCAPALTDAAGGPCIAASTTPELGKLYPLSNDLFVEDLSGDVGIGTTAPSAGLHVFSIRGLVATGIFGTGATPVQGAGTRMQWSSYRAAFRAGFVSSTQWDEVNVGSYSTAVGRDTTASGLHSVAMGHGTTASGGTSTAMGSATDATGSFSTAMGTGTVATGTYSTAMGRGTMAGAYVVTAIGRYNVGTGDPVNWVSTDPLFEIGNGADDSTRANALTVLKNGNVGIGKTAPLTLLDLERTGAGTLIQSTALGATATNAILAQSAGTTGVGVYAGATHATGANYGLYATTNSPNGYAGYFSGRVQVDGGSDATPTGGGYVQMGPSSGVNIVVDNNEIMARNNGAVAALSLNVDGGDLYFSQSGSGRMGIQTNTPAFDLHVDGDAGKPGGGSWSVASDARLKKNVEDLDGALERLLALRGVTFEYIDPKSIGELEGQRIGFIAQEVEQVFPDWVGEKDDGMKFVSVSGFEALAVEALRELDGENQALRAASTAQAAELAALRAELGEMRSLVHALVRQPAPGGER